ncbi:MAG: DUF3737 family protein [Lachnospiraceae bacterium]|nr:DUF3737 family protein [Lachnospiraceae bacterium]
MNEIREKVLKGERALFAQKDTRLVNCVFCDGESPLKEGRDLELEGCIFEWKYPLWYCNNVKVKGSNWYEMGRAGVWYTNDITVEGAVIEAPKNFRRCRNVRISDTIFSYAGETLWTCDGVDLKNVTVSRGDYLLMNSSNIKVDGLKLSGNYSFDGAKNVEIRNSTLMTKDAFWNSENVTVYDSFISGEYLGWNSKNLKLVNCTIESLQGMCYVDNLVMENCRLINTTLAFEYSNVEADISSSVVSVFNPSSGTIKAESIGELIIEPDKIDPSKTRIVCSGIEKRSDRPEWLR